MKTTFGIIGAGNIGKTVARHLAKAGYTVAISNSKGPESLAGVVADLGETVKAVTAQKAAQADIVILALPWAQLSTLTGLTDWSGKVVIDATNHFVTYAPDFKLADLNGRASSEVVQDFVPGAYVVKAFNTLYFKVLELDPQEGNGKRVIFISGDHDSAKVEVKNAIETIGFAVVDLGTLAASKIQQPNEALASLNLIKL